MHGASSVSVLHSIVQSLYDAMFGVYRNGLCYKGIILQWNYRKMTISFHGHFPIVSLNNSMVKRFWS